LLHIAILTNIAFSIISNDRQPRVSDPAHQRTIEARDGRLPTHDPKERNAARGKAATTSRRQTGDTQNSRRRRRQPASLAAILQRALDEPADAVIGEDPNMTKREVMIRGLVERSAAGELAATKLLFELLRKADPRAIGPDPASDAPLAENALDLLKERIARLALAQTASLPGTAADAGPLAIPSSAAAQPAPAPCADSADAPQGSPDADKT
jgi:hypothetical protein